ncbi:Integrin beta-1-binding protein 2 [Symbiodinium microadriaticum]|uniref:Integrin beta-1-binding protein 2 n=1 Tax=Symbiodinium microadriaticum TaxID=2951 RepID=A0A1Q9F629_SYMMI|nr:Integrin beta-1-binding protein 2 [Symbiodinium microadriaticum]
MNDDGADSVTWLALAILLFLGGRLALSRPRAGGQQGQSRLLSESSQMQQEAGVSEPGRKEAVPSLSERPVSKSLHRYQLTPSDLLAGTAQVTEHSGEGSASSLVWDVQSTEDAAALLAGCPLDLVIACSFQRAYAPHYLAQQEAVRKLAEAQPAGMAFACVDLSCKDVAEWAGVREPEVRLLQPDGSVMARLNPQEVKTGALHKLALDKAKSLAQSAEQKLDALSERFPNALRSELDICLPRDSPEKMNQNAVDTVQKMYGCESPEAEMVDTLCRTCQKGSVPRPRFIAGLAKIIRASDAKSSIPFLDLSRRLAGLKLCGGAEPGAQEALELLLDSSLCKVDESPGPGPCMMLALQLLANCFHQPSLAEALLPVVAQFVQAPAWPVLWSEAPGTSQSHLDKARDAAAILLLNASVVLRQARLRATHAPLLEHSVLALKRCPNDQRLNWTVANLLAMGGGVDEAKSVLQAQPMTPLRLLAAAVFNDQLSGPDSVAFPAAWHPPTTSTAMAPANDQRRRPGRAIPARHAAIEMAAHMRLRNTASSEASDRAAQKAAGPQLKNLQKEFEEDENEREAVRKKRCGRWCRTLRVQLWRPRAMKVTLKYEEAQTEDLFMTLRLTLPQKYVNGTNKEVVKLFVDHYNKKKADNMLSSEDLHLKIVGGIHLDNEERVRDSLSNGDECYLLGKDSEGPAPKRQEAEKGYQCTPAAASNTTETKVAKNADGKVRCKNFGCQMTFDPNGPPQECLHHKSAPIFHETAKWWSCCPDKKAYEFDEFMRIPGCTKGFCSSESQGKKANHTIVAFEWFP